MKPNPDCPRCDGTGWKQVVNDGVEAVERCDCFQRDRGETLLSRAQIPERFREADFDNFSPGSPRENPIAHEALIKVMLGAKAYARDYPSLSQLGLLLQGATGVGKTHLATAVLRQLLSRGFECVFLITKLCLTAFAKVTIRPPGPPTNRPTERRSTPTLS